MLRTTFALDIPPDASPAFQLQVGDESFPMSTRYSSQRHSRRDVGSAALCESPENSSKFQAHRQTTVKSGVVESSASFIAASILGTAVGGDDLSESSKDHTDEEG
ncbi:hypothetical protein BDP27DRAFT_45300 [Rhodocollybia butyracea]|uniref:Uncharacterized protein n=1 Tax=Rhodocollybia butyracea TaxID=206335 RepID=A0A9P5U4I4_9AGAR|nr:hypothetical protein BDP27DRAFT_45300 [Rhodocollybia butyracea]